MHMTNLKGDLMNSKLWNYIALDEFDTGLNIIIAIVQKVWEWTNCSFAKMVYS